ncbi:TetR/AcrR family transcriptional regulator [Streptomyces sp. NPDC051954]|uniref:TetR/AcrR family transcriptional regulator n=1 Tax=unclassified Streptomyces TaxID=2593676 RepID=UPI0034359E4D
MDDHVKSRREEYADSTRGALIDCGRRLFVEQGYAQTSAAEIVQAARLTRGALYHHFEGKQGLFEAIFEDVERGLADRFAEVASKAAEDGAEPWEQVFRAVDLFLDECTQEAYLRIVLQEGPIALGWTRWRELDGLYMSGLLRTAIEALVESGLATPMSVEMATRAVYGLLTELAWGIAEADNQPTARRDAGLVARQMISSLQTS